MEGSDYPLTGRRPRRLRRTPGLRDLVRETSVTASDLVMPLFVMDGTGKGEPIASLPGQQRWTLDGLVREGERLAGLGLRGVALFPKIDPARKDAKGTEALNEQTLVLRATRALKAAVPELLIFTDIALDPYTDHGHDGVLTADGTDVDNDRTVALLRRQAVLAAAAGVDVVAPSDMMDGRIGAIRDALDEDGFHGTAILSYAVKYASAFYGPFRDAVGSAQAAGTRLLGKQTYQMDPANRREARVEWQLDEQEGADFLMVKPAGPYLDIIRELRDDTSLPVAAYQVSGEYAMLHAAAQAGWLDLRRCRDEALLGIKRAGADVIFSYFAAEVAAELKAAKG